MKKWLPCIALLGATVVAIVAIWWPEYLAWFYGVVCKAWKWIATALVVVTAGPLLACSLRALTGGKRIEAPGADDDAEESQKLDPPHPESPVWKSISGFRYETDLKLMRLKRGLEHIDREAQYIVAKDYTVSFDLDRKRRSITVPKGTLTDLSSAPRLFRIFVGRVGPHLEATIVHDYQYVAWQLKKECPAPNEQMRRFADELMLVAMNAAGMGCKARLIYWAVRWFGCTVFHGEDPEPLILPEDRFPEHCSDETC